MSGKQDKTQSEKSPSTSSDPALTNLEPANEVPVDMSASQQSLAALARQQSAQQAPADPPSLDRTPDSPLRGTSLGASAEAAAAASASITMDPDQARQPSLDAHAEASDLAGASGAGPPAVASSAVINTTAPPKTIQETAETSPASASPHVSPARPKSDDETGLAAPTEGVLLQDLLTKK
jgi:hypothetical protein